MFYLQFRVKETKAYSVPNNLSKATHYQLNYISFDFEGQDLFIVSC